MGFKRSQVQVLSPRFSLLEIEKIGTFVEDKGTSVNHRDGKIGPFANGKGTSVTIREH